MLGYDYIGAPLSAGCSSPLWYGLRAMLVAAYICVLPKNVDFHIAFAAIQNAASVTRIGVVRDN